MKRKRLFYDIETSYTKGIFWSPGPGQTILPQQILEYPKIICISYKWEGEKTVYNLDWNLTKQCDKLLLQKFVKIIDQADEIVGHNGDNFDLKWIRTRAVFHNIEMKNFYNSIDTLKLCRSYLNLPSNKLGEVAKYYSLSAKGDPGGLQTWIDIVEKKDRKALKRMIDYCNQDVVVLEKVFNKLKPYVKHNSNYATLEGKEKHNCPECGNSDIRLTKTYTTAAGTIKRQLRCKDPKCGICYTVTDATYTLYLENQVSSLKKIKTK
jgi:hypothetical protein